MAAVRRARISKRPYEFNKGSNRYDYIFCDEVQDIPNSFIRSMKNMAGHVIVAGDPNQSIYDSDPQLHEPTVDPDDITPLISGTEYKLSTIHRLTRSIISSIGKTLICKQDLVNLLKYGEILVSDNIIEHYDKYESLSSDNDTTLRRLLHHSSPIENFSRIMALCFDHKARIGEHEIRVRIEDVLHIAPVCTVAGFAPKSCRNLCF